MQLIPHRPPFLLVDEILELEPGKRVVGRREIRADDWWFPGHFPERPVMPGVLTIEAIAQAGAVAVLADEANAGKIPFFAGIDAAASSASSSRATCSRSSASSSACAGRSRRGKARALVGDEVAARGEAHRLRRRMIGDGDNGTDLDHRARVQGAGPRRLERRARASTSRRPNEWILERTGIRERRMAAKEEALSDVALPACVDALAQAGVDGQGHRPADRRDRHARHGVPVDRRDPRRPARRGGRSGLRPLGRLHRLHVRARAGVRDARRRAREAGARRRRRPALAHPRLGRTARRSCSSATARARSCSRRRRRRGFLGFELGADGGGGENLWLPGSGSRIFDEADRHVKMNGREVFKFATRILVQSAEDVLRELRRHDRRTWTSTSRIRRTCGSSTTQPGSSASRLTGW